MRRVIAPNPSKMTGPGTNTYAVGGDRLALIDPGPEDDVHLARLLDLYGDRAGWVVVTHTHIDHSPLSRRLAEATGAVIVGFGPPPAASRTGPTGVDPHDADFRPELVLGDDNHIDVDGLRLRAVWTPGHASNHLCLELDGTGLLFSGDHVMSGSTVVIAPPDGDMAVYMESLEKVRRRRPARIAPGHGGMIDDPATVLDDYLRHRREREQQIVGVLPAGTPEQTITIGEIVAALYVGVPDDLHPVARYSVWAHLRKLAAEGAAVSAEVDDIEAPWRAVTPAG